MNVLADEIVYVARLGGTKGNKGFIKLISKDSLDKIEGKKVILKDKSLDIIEVEKIKDNTIKFKGIENINEAKKLVNREIHIFKRDTDVFNNLLESELIDKEVFFEKESIGKIVSFSYTTKYKILNIKGKKEYSIPFTKDFFKTLKEEKLFLIKEPGEYN